ncbi:carbamoyl-phosphate synthase B [Artemisia annua]|uniref:Carbamoyl-phosphate synthase B n=1 Tax=Artemisia annua TaxID=35608 RepID=A0A2U1Q982_ARTAN|nr:carbamoyl-phosphate synthase B [Artemisia annua]
MVKVNFHYGGVFEFSILLAIEYIIFIGIDFRGDQIWNDVIMNRDVVAIIVGEMNQKVVRSLTIVLEVTKFATPKKFAREAIEKLLGSKLVLNTQMKSIVELMLVRNMCEEAFQNVEKSFECCYPQWGCVVVIEIHWNWDTLKGSHTVPVPGESAMKGSFEVDVIHESSSVVKWFLGQLGESVNVVKYSVAKLLQITRDEFNDVKKHGLSDKKIVYAAAS